MEQYKLSILDRWQFARKHIARTLLVATVASLSAYGVYYSICAEGMVRVAESKANSLEGDNKNLLDILNGKKAMVDHTKGERYAVIERVTWEVVEE